MTLGGAVHRGREHHDLEYDRRVLALRRGADELAVLDLVEARRDDPGELGVRRKHDLLGTAPSAVFTVIMPSLTLSTVPRMRSGAATATAVMAARLAAAIKLTRIMVETLPMLPPCYGAAAAKVKNIVRN